jgi:hypothetical protein
VLDGSAADFGYTASIVIRSTSSSVTASVVRSYSSRDDTGLSRVAIA